MQKHLFFQLLVALFFFGGCRPAPEDYMDPAIGNIATLLKPTRPVIQLPNEMVRVYPLRRDGADDQITGFPLQVAAHNDGALFIMKPSSRPLSPAEWQRRCTYDPVQEVIHPWYYSTMLIEDSIRVEFAPGSKTGVYRFSFPENADRKLLFTAPLNFSGNTFTARTFFHGDVPVYVYGRFNTAITAGLVSDTLSCVRFPHRKERVVVLQYAISYVSTTQAKQHFQKEMEGRDMETVIAEGRGRWHAVATQVQVEGGTVAQRRSFYTALYRCHERMVNITEDGVYYSGYNKKVNLARRSFYVDDATWDTYQALHPLRMILHPEQEEDMLDAYVTMYEQSGWMPTFPRLYGDHPCMNGFHSTVIFLDAWRKGLKIPRMAAAYEGMRKNALSATMLPWRNGPAGALDSFYQAKGYYPALRPGDTETVAGVHPFEKRQAVAVTLGHSYDDWALSQLAADLHRYDDQRLFAARAENFRRLWHDSVRFFLPKDNAGRWIMIDPAWDGGPGGRDYYDENNGWTYLWAVQHNIPALVRLMGGEKAFERRLDELFHTVPAMPRYDFWHRFPDATGLVGQFSMGNEPGFHIPYLYNYVGAAWKTQRQVRMLLDLWFKDNVFGIPGDEDGGGMSAFVVFSSLGFYPVTPGVPVYAIGSPVFRKATIRLPQGKRFTLIARHCSEVNQYIRRAWLNGEILHSPFFTHQQLMEGGTLELEMVPFPERRWGASIHAPLCR